MQWLYMQQSLPEVGAHLSVSQASQFLAVSIDTLRRWDKKGLIKATRSAQGHRLFLRQDLELIKAKLNGQNPVCWQVLERPEKSAYKTVELFAGTGGLALGLENAGLHCEMLVEIDKDACATLRRNRPQWDVRCVDIRALDFSTVQADIVTGGFPCQAFSYAGKRLGFNDVRGTLFYEYARAIQQITPQVILAENVRGLEKHDQGRTLATMLKILDDIGYHVAYRVLKAQYFDVPQKRERLVIIGIRKGKLQKIAFPKEKNYTISIKEALKAVPVSFGQQYTEKKYMVMQHVPEGGYWRDLPLELQQSYMGASFYHTGGRTGMARRLAWDEPSLTLTCNPAQKQTERCHPEETRPLTIREYARIQSFPDAWQFAGSVASQYRQIGNAVPVNLGFHIGSALIAMMDQTFDDAVEVIDFS